MSEHNFEIGDNVSGVRNGYRVWYGTVTTLCGHGIECWEQDFRVYIYIPNHMLYTLTNVTKQQKATQDNQSTTSEQESKEQQMKEQNIKPKNIKPEDEVTITVNYRDLALAYAVLGKTTGPDSMLYKQARAMLDPNWKAYDSLNLRNKTSDQILRYGDYYKEFESLLFPQEPIEIEQQKQIRELREQAEAMQEQSKALLEKAKTLESNQK